MGRYTNSTTSSMADDDGQVFSWDSERGFYWFVAFSSPRAELLLVTVLTSIRTTLDFSCTTASLVTCSLYAFTLLEK